MKTKQTAGTLYCTLGVLAFTSAVNAAPPIVTCVPFDGQHLAFPHVTLSGIEITLKGTAHDPDGDAELDTYEWDFGDGPSSGETGVVSDPYVIEARHTYVGEPGDYFSATLTVADVNGESDSDSYLVMIPETPDPKTVLIVKVNMAIDEGLWRLHKDQVRGTYPDSADYGYWPYGDHTASATGASTEAFEMHGHVPTVDASEDPYVETVQRGLRYLLNQMHVHDIFLQEAGDPDINGNGIGLGCYTDWSHSMYECGITLMTFASSKAPDLIADTGPADWVRGRTYAAIVQDMVDYLAFGQSDLSTGEYRGGWRYYANWGESDNSCSQWPVIGMEAAENPYNCFSGNYEECTSHGGVTIPGFVKPELDLWIDYIQNDMSGGSGYMGPDDWVNVAKTGGLLCEMAFVHDPESGEDPPLDTARGQAAVDFIGNQWWSDWEHFWSNSYYAFYSVMKGFRLLDPLDPTDAVNAQLGFDWYYDPEDGYAQYLIDQQAPDGTWYDGYYSGHPLATAWAILTLLTHPICWPPIANAGPDVLDHPPLIEIEFDASDSSHTDPNLRIIEYCWDFCDSDGVDWENPDYCSADPIAHYAYPAVYNPDGTIDWDATSRCCVVTLRVKDNGEEPCGLTDEDTLTVCITPPPWAPVALLDIPDPVYKCQTIVLDGSASYDPNGQFYPDPAHPWHGYLVSYEWDLDNDGEYDDAIGETIEWSSCETGLYVVCLKVTNNFGESHAVCGVINVVNQRPVAEAGGPYCCSMGEVVFDGSGSWDPDPGETETLRYRWDFEGDGFYDTSWSSEPTATHTYPECMEYTATLQVEDVNGARGTDTAEVRPCFVSCFGVNKLKIRTKEGKCQGIALLEVTSDQGVLVYEPDEGKDKLNPSTVVDDGVNGRVRIHTSCSQPLDVGDVFGPYTVTDVVKIFDDEDSENMIELRGDFDPAGPLDLSVDDVTYTIDDGQGHVFTFAIPGGSFDVEGNPADQRFRFDSPKGDHTDLTARFDFGTECKFELDVKKITGTKKISSTTLTVSLIAGINLGEEVIETQARPQYLMYRAHPEVDCCPMGKNDALREVIRE